MSFCDTVFRMEIDEDVLEDGMASSSPPPPPPPLLPLPPSPPQTLLELDQEQLTGAIFTLLKSQVGSDIHGILDPIENLNLICGLQQLFLMDHNVGLRNSVVKCLTIEIQEATYSQNQIRVTTLSNLKVFFVYSLIFFTTFC
jgi:hypothetical protein